MVQSYRRLRNRTGVEEGHALTEYALIMALLAAALIVALIALTGGIEGAVREIIGTL